MSKFIDKINLDDEYTQVELDVTTTNKVNELVVAYNEGVNGLGFGRKVLDGERVYVGKQYIFIPVEMTDENYISMGIYSSTTSTFVPFATLDYKSLSVFSLYNMSGTIGIITSNGFIESSVNINDVVVFNSGDYDCYLLELA